MLDKAFLLQINAGKIKNVSKSFFQSLKIQGSKKCTIKFSFIAFVNPVVHTLHVTKVHSFFRKMARFFGTNLS